MYLCLVIHYVAMKKSGGFERGIIRAREAYFNVLVPARILKQHMNRLMCKTTPRQQAVGHWAYYINRLGL